MKNIDVLKQATTDEMSEWLAATMLSISANNAGDKELAEILLSCPPTESLEKMLKHIGLEKVYTSLKHSIKNMLESENEEGKISCIWQQKF